MKHKTMKTDYIKISTSGRVGIGITNPSHEIEIKGDIAKSISRFVIAYEALFLGKVHIYFNEKNLIEALK